MSKSNEAFWWSLFSAGGVLAALCLPAIILATGFLLPTQDTAHGVNRYEQVQQVVAFWPVRIALLLVISLSFFHCAHRIRHTLMDMGLRSFEPVLKLFCYGGAIAGTVAGVVVLLNL